MDTIVRINMGADGGPSISKDSLGDYDGMGGRGMTSSIISKEVDPQCHPLSADNKLVIAPGLLSGTAAAIRAGPARPRSWRGALGGAGSRRSGRIAAS